MSEITPMNDEDLDVSGMSDEALFAVAEDGSLFLERLQAMEALGRRAVADHSLLERLLRAMGPCVSIEARNGVPLASTGLAALLGARSQEVDEAVARAASEWSVLAQHDLFFLHFDRHERVAALERLRAAGLKPKVAVAEDGALTLLEDIPSSQ